MKRRLLLAAPALLGMIGRAGAQGSWPSRPVTVVVPFAPGSSADIVARMVALRMQQATGQSFLVESRPGATGEVGARYVIRSPGDGYMLMHAPLSTWAINAAIRPNLSYDPVTDLTSITQTVRTPNVLIVNPQQVPANTLPEFVDWLKRNAGKVAYSSSGTGASDHLTAEMFKQRTGTDVTHVPYNGGGQPTTDLIAGNVQMSFQNLGSVLPHIRGGRVKAILLTAERRSQHLPDLPTAIEAGLPGFVVYSWQALGGPPNMPPTLVQQINAAAVAGMRHPETVARMNDLGFEVVAGTPEELQAFQRAEIASWRRVVTEGNIRPD